VVVGISRFEDGFFRDRGYVITRRRRSSPEWNMYPRGSRASRWVICFRLPGQNSAVRSTVNSICRAPQGHAGEAADAFAVFTCSRIGSISVGASAQLAPSRMAGPACFGSLWNTTTRCRLASKLPVLGEVTDRFALALDTQTDSRLVRRHLLRRWAKVAVCCDRSIGFRMRVEPGRGGGPCCRQAQRNFSYTHLAQPGR